MAPLSADQRVREVVEPLLAGSDFELVDVVLEGATVRVTVDRPDGIDLEAVTEATRMISTALDQADAIPPRHLLEVSSPGIERPLHRPDHFRRAVGATVAVKTRPEVEGERRVEGVLESADDAGVVVAGRALTYNEIDRARTTFSWGNAASGSRSGPKRAGLPARRQPKSATVGGERSSQ